MTKFVSVAVGAGLVLLLGVYFFSPRSGPIGTATLTKTTEPVYELDKTEANLGNMQVNDKKSADFNFRNNGSEAVQLSHVQTSCNCTSARVTIAGETSPEFNMPMHMSDSETTWRTELPVGQTATITVTYDPTKMPVYGSIERYATFMANSKEVKLTVKAFVQ